MHDHPLRTTVVGSYPLPGWLEFASRNLDQFGADDIAEMQDDAVIAAIHDQLTAGLDVITDGEQTRLDFNLSFYGFLEGISSNESARRQFGPPAHDQRGRHEVTGEILAPRGLGVVEEYRRLALLAPPGPTLKASVPGPYTMSGRLVPNSRYKDRYELTEALLPIVRDELIALVRAGCGELTIDEPSMSCYAYRGGSPTAGRYLQPDGRANRRGVPALDASLLRQLQGPRGRPATLCADVSRFPRFPRG
jgi:5-methyltetrahydropteroyltriglutamate--homocysteine methyltransferase